MQYSARTEPKLESDSDYAEVLNQQNWTEEEKEEHIEGRQSTDWHNIVDKGVNNIRRWWHWDCLSPTEQTVEAVVVA